MAAGAVTIPGLGHVPVPVAVRRVALLAETGVIVEPGRDYLVKAQRRPQRLGDPPGVPDANRIPVTVAAGHAVQDQVPLACGLPAGVDSGLTPNIRVIFCCLCAR